MINSDGHQLLISLYICARISYEWRSTRILYRCDVNIAILITRSSRQRSTIVGLEVQQVGARDTNLSGQSSQSPLNTFTSTTERSKNISPHLYFDPLPSLALQMSISLPHVPRKDHSSYVPQFQRNQYVSYILFWPSDTTLN